MQPEIDELMRAFFGAFTNTGGRAPDVDVIRRVCLPQAMIIKNVGGETVIYDLDAFIEPRRALLTGGRLTEFTEWEVEERTEVAGTIAHRLSRYRKSGVLDGEPFTGSGHKTSQFIRTAGGWRISSLAWDDDPEPTAPGDQDRAR